MAQQYSFFNADLINGKYDRTYNAEDWAEYFASFIGNGVSFQQGNLQVSSSTGMEVIVSPGIAFINGYRYANTSPLNIKINLANGTYSRITSIVIELNLAERQITCLALDGTPSPSPVSPQLTTNQSIYQLQLATILIPPATTQIINSNITDTRGDKTVCPWLDFLTPKNGELTKLQNEVTSLQQNSITANSDVTFTNNIAFTPNGQLSFQNSQNQNIVGFYSQGNNFVVADLLTNNVALNFALANNNLLLTSYMPTTFNDNVVFEDDVKITYPMTISEANGEISFQNSSNGKNVSIAVYGNQFVLQNAITSNFIFGITPVSNGTDTLNFYSNSVFGQATTFNANATFNAWTTVENMSVDDYLYIKKAINYENNYHLNYQCDNMPTLQQSYDSSSWALTNLTTGNGVIQISPSTTMGADEITVGGNVTVNGEISAPTANINNLTASGTPVFNEICNQQGTIVVDGYNVNYSVTGWYMDQYLLSGSPAGTASLLGVIAVNLTGPDVDIYTSSFTIPLQGNPFNNNENLTGCMGINVPNIALQATTTPFYISKITPSSIRISLDNTGQGANLSSQQIRTIITN